MIEMYALATVALLACGAVLGVLGVLAVGIRCEQRAGRGQRAGYFAARSPGRAASGARAINGLLARR